MLGNSRQPRDRLYQIPRSFPNIRRTFSRDLTTMWLLSSVSALILIPTVLAGSPLPHLLASRQLSTCGKLLQSACDSAYTTDGTQCVTAVCGAVCQDEIPLIAPCCTDKSTSFADLYNCVAQVYGGFTETFLASTSTTARSRTITPATTTGLLTSRASTSKTTSTTSPPLSPVLTNGGDETSTATSAPQATVTVTKIGAGERLSLEGLGLVGSSIAWCLAFALGFSWL